MMTLTKITEWVVRVTGPLLVALGLLFWSGHALSLLPLHMLIGATFVLALLALAGLAAWAGLRWPLVLLAMAFALVIPAFGMMQTRLLPGPTHWVVRVTHLSIGIVGMVVAARLARFIQSHPRRQHVLAVETSTQG